jgi:hypothetical protein
VELIEKLAKAITNLKRVGPGLGEFVFDQEYFSWSIVDAGCQKGKEVEGGEKDIFCWECNENLEYLNPTIKIIDIYYFPHILNIYSLHKYLKMQKIINLVHSKWS